MSKGFASASAQQANRPKTLEAIVLSQRLNDCFPFKTHGWERTRLHQLSDILTIAILAVLSGGNGWKDRKSTESVNKRGYRHFSPMAFPVRIRFRECSSG